MRWTLLQFKNILDNFLANCSPDMLAKILSRLDRLSETGNETKFPITAPLKDGLFELRGRSGNTQARLIFYFSTNKRIFFVHAFYKSDSKIRQRDLDIANKNRKIIQEKEDSAHGFDLIH